MSITRSDLESAILSGATGDGPIEIKDRDPLGKGTPRQWRLGYDPASKRFTIYVDPADHGDEPAMQFRAHGPGDVHTESQG